VTSLDTSFYVILISKYFLGLRDEKIKKNGVALKGQPDGTKAVAKFKNYTNKKSLIDTNFGRLCGYTS
jgi:hypothetical protein